MRIIKGASFKIAGGVVTPLKAQCQQCGYHFKFVADQALTNGIWSLDAPLACYKCNPSVWLDAMIVRMYELHGFPFLIDKVQI